MTVTLAVAPHAGAWIEIRWRHPNQVPIPWSLPMRERGLKSQRGILGATKGDVAPHAGAWIEIRTLAAIARHVGVAPHAGAWIEIGKSTSVAQSLMSLPMRERGLKYQQSVA